MASQEPAALVENRGRMQRALLLRPRNRQSLVASNGLRRIVGGRPRRLHGQEIGEREGESPAIPLR